MTVSITDRGDHLHDQALLDALAALASTPFEGTVYRATRTGADPRAFSPNGGRWAPPSTWQLVPVLYTCVERDGALAEMSAWLSQLTPPPKKPIRVHRLRVVLDNAVRIDRGQLEQLGVDMATYGARRYARPGEAPPSLTQQIGAALSFLGVSGFFAPSARWPADNLMILDSDLQHSTVEPIEAEDVDWLTWFQRSPSMALAQTIGSTMDPAAGFRLPASAGIVNRALPATEAL